jgi:hypothetical protein
MSILLTAAALAAAGCDKKAQITFNNLSDRTVQVNLTGPGKGTGVLGGMPPGGRIRTKIKVSKSMLPAPYRWTAGPFSGQFTITKKTGKKLWIDVGTGRGPRDKNVEIQEQKESTRTEVTTEEVVTPD